MVLLNLYPYANGHLLVALGDARPTLLEYDPEQRAAFWSLVEHAASLMQRALDPPGINFGINQGAAAGAGPADEYKGDSVHTIPDGTHCIQYPAHQ